MFKTSETYMIQKKANIRIHYILQGHKIIFVENNSIEESMLDLSKPVVTNFFVMAR